MIGPEGPKTDLLWAIWRPRVVQTRYVTTKTYVLCFNPREMEFAKIRGSNSSHIRTLTKRTPDFLKNMKYVNHQIEKVPDEQEDLISTFFETSGVHPPGPCRGAIR